MQKVTYNMPDSPTQKGFSLLELLIVIAVILILSSVIVVVLNPSEALKKSRDTQRLADLETVSRALTQYVASLPDPILDWFAVGSCLTSDPTFTNQAAISYSAPAAGSPSCLYSLVEGSDATAQFASLGTIWCIYSSDPTAIDGSGWVHTDFTSIPGGSPLASLPVDPINAVADPNNPKSTDLAYRYACQEKTTNGKPPYVFELDAVLESKFYTLTDNKLTGDGGDNDKYYETGSSTKLIGAGEDF